MIRHLLAVWFVSCAVRTLYRCRHLRYSSCEQYCLTAVWHWIAEAMISCFKAVSKKMIWDNVYRIIFMNQHQRLQNKNISLIFWRFLIEHSFRAYSINNYSTNRKYWRNLYRAGLSCHIVLYLSFRVLCDGSQIWGSNRREGSGDLWHTTSYYEAQHNGTIKERKWSGNSVLHAGVIYPSHSLQTKLI